MYCQSCGAYNPDGNSICLNCRQPLPTRGAAGSAFCRTHPDVAAASPCSRCGTFYCANCLHPVGTQWLCDDCLGKGSTLPWDERESVGLWRAWWRNSLAMISRPVQTLMTAKPDAPMGDSLLLAVVSMLVGMGPTIVLYAIGFGLFGLFSPGLSKVNGFSGAVVPFVAMIYLVVLVLFQVVGTIITAGIDHLALMVLGGNPKSYTVTLRANAVAMGPYLLGLVPLCGLYVFPIWAIVLRIFALMHFHQVSGGKATAAVLGPLVLFCGLCGMVYAAIFAMAGLGNTFAR